MTTGMNTTKHTAADVQEQYVHNTQMLAKRLAAAQARNVKYTQSIFESTIALLKSHMENTRFLMEQWEQQGNSQVSGPLSGPLPRSIHRLSADARGSGDLLPTELRELSEGNRAL